MELQELYQLIDLQPEMIQKLESIGEKMDLEELNPYLEQLTDRKTAESSYQALKALFEGDTDHLKMLYCHLECARRIFDRYQEKHIPQAVYVDTMKCFTRFIGECEKKHGRMFFDRGWWTYRQTSMSLFRIGQLEYEFEEHEGEKVIAFHIPSDADFSREAVDDSIRQAELFFQTYYPEYEYGKYTCDSWLMSPALRPLLSETSHIMSFQNRFSVIREDKESKDYIEWLFQVPVDTDYEKLPADTGLQKKVREMLLHGGTVGAAYGVINCKRPLNQNK